MLNEASSSRIAWRRFTRTFLVGAALALVALLGLAYAIDPYDSGRSTLFAKPGVRPQGPRTAGASRGRDPAFNAAIIGNSHIQLLSPERLKAKTGLAFVQLSVPGTGPREQLAVAEWFLRHRGSPPEALVVGADATWCTDDSGLAIRNPFPFWLYSANPFAYARGLLRFDTLEELPRRIGYVFDDGAARARPDGYWDYEAETEAGPAARERVERAAEAGVPTNATGRFPAAERLRDLALSLPPGVALILVIPPVYIGPGSRPDPAQRAADESCKTALRAALADRPAAAVVDWRTDRPENRDASLYLDRTHYRRPVAEIVENEVAAAVRRMR